MADQSIQTGWQLLVRVAVDPSRRVQCQCRRCGKTVYADIHIIQWSGGEIACWGSRCFQREMGVRGENTQACYPRVNGRRLTDEERDLLDANREALIARIKGIEDEIIRVEEHRAQLRNWLENFQGAKPTNLLDASEKMHPPAQPHLRTQPFGPLRYEERAHKFTILFRSPSGEILDEFYRGSEAFCRRYINQNIAGYPVGTTAEILVTRTRQLVYSQE